MRYREAACIFEYNEMLCSKQWLRENESQLILTDILKFVDFKQTVTDGWEV